MQLAKVRSILWLIGGAAAAGAVASLLAVLVLPLGATNPLASTKSAAGILARNEMTPTTLPLASFEQAWQMPLRRPLVEAPAAIVVEGAPPAAAVPAIRLVGTIVDGQHPRGIFTLGLSAVEMKTVGDTIGSAKILAIDADSATLSGDTGTITLHREKKPFDPSGDRYNAPAAIAPPSETKDSPE